jgi:hypothetical protein
MLNRHRKLNIEQMEAREMMAGDVAGYVSNNTLFLYEAYGQTGRDNSVVVSQVVPGTVRVRGGVTADGTTSKVNGVAYKDFQVTGGLNIAFGGGNDTVYLGPSANTSAGGSSGGVLGAPSFHDVTLNLAAPTTTTSRTSTSTTSFIAVSPPDKDQVTLNGLKIPGLLTINTGADDDKVTVLNTIVGQSNLKSGSPNSGGITVNTGLGNDVIAFDGLASNHDINVDAGAGNDKLDVRNTSVIDNFMAELGDGDDVMSIYNLSATSAKSRISGGNGTDRVTSSWFFSGPTTEVVGWEYINGVQQPLFSLSGDLVTRV